MNWHHFYNHLTKLLILYYENNPINTGNKLYHLFITKPSFSNLNPWIFNFKSWDVESLDPIHIFASFNYYDISKEKRNSFFIYMN